MANRYTNPKYEEHQAETVEEANLREAVRLYEQPRPGLPPTLIAVLAALFLVALATLLILQLV